uniref:Lipoprotein n=1 Tax=Globodera rostochiensis TaxID=31243 RepID=A0A914IDP7_GLORO
MILTVTLFVALAFSSNCDPSEEGAGPFKFVGTVMPQGNYRIFVRTLPAEEMEKIMRTYDYQIDQSKNAWHSHELNSDLKWKKVNFENTFGVLGDGTITDGTKFEIKLDWKKRHDPYLKREFDPIYVQIYAVKDSKKTSLMERMLFNPSSEVEYEFIYGTPRDQIGVKKFLLGHIPNPENMEQYVMFHKYSFSNGMYQVVDTDGNFAIEFASDKQAPQEFYLSFYEAKKLQNIKANVFTIKDPSTFLNDANELEVKIDFLNGKWFPVETEKPKSKAAKGTKAFKLSGIIENLPKIDGREVDGIEVKLFTSDPLAGDGSSSSDRIPSKDKLKFNFELSELDIQIGDIEANAGTNSIDSNKSTTIDERLLQKKIGPIYLMVTPLESPSTKVLLRTQKWTYPTLTQMVQNGEDLSRYHYKFCTKEEAEKGDFALRGEKEKMVNLYTAYLKRTERAYLIPDEIYVYKLSLQMVHIKPLGTN